MLRRLSWCFIAVCLTLLGSAAPSFGQSIDMVEEEWELNINHPRPSRGSPQLGCLMSPVGNTASVYAMFVINKRSAPDSQDGGLQAQIWSGDTLLAVGDLQGTAPLDVVGERIRWTQRMRISKGVLTFEILNGTSDTWGKFGGNGELACSATVNLANLNNYSHEISAENSGVDFGHGRVKKLILRKVRTYSNGKKSVERTLDRVVFPN